MSGCSSDLKKDRKPAWEDALSRAWAPAEQIDVDVANIPPSSSAATQAENADHSFYKPGSNKFVAPATSVAQARQQVDGDIKLNFQNANLLEVIKVILGDMLGVTYVVDPGVQGAVSMQTTKPLSRDDMIPTLELLLRMNDAALVIEDGIYRIMPLALALTGAGAPQLGDATTSLPPGYTVRIVPLRYVAAEEMAQILEPFVADTNQLVRIDSKRNLLILAADGNKMDRLLETIHVFDVDRMAGMSVAMFTPDFVDAKTLAEELDKLLANPETGLMAGLVRFIVVERLNGLMVVTPRSEYLSQLREWVERLDRDNGAVGRRLFIYRVQNGKATELAETLSTLFKPKAQSDVPAAELAPGLDAEVVGDVEGDVAAEPPPRALELAASDANGLSIGENADVRIIADEPNNALLILASTIEYRQILSALKQLDISPMQVLVEVTIAEVSLTDNLQYGVEWFFNNTVGSSLTGFGLLDLGTSGLAGVVPGFSYALKGGDGTVNAVINLLSSESNLSIVSSPTLLVLNNQEATIQVGDEVPVATQQQQSTATNANIINSIEYRETGVQLKVKPRINSGGLVIMEVEQETSLVPATNNVDPLTPRIQTRKISSTVAVNSGDTIILGGLIEDNRDLSESGVPELHKVPLFGNLFGATSDKQDRTELLVLITPRAISHRNAALQVTEEFRRKLNSLVPVEGSVTPPVQGDVPADGKPPLPAAAPTRATPEQDKVTTAPADMPAATLLCERIGPFQDTDPSASLASLGGEVQRRVSKSVNRTGVGYRVLVVGQQGPEQANETLEQLRDDGFEEALLYTAGPSANSIALGLFSSQNNAQRLADKVSDEGYPVELHPVTREQIEYWIELQYAGHQPSVDSWFQSIDSSKLRRRSCDHMAAI